MLTCSYLSSLPAVPSSLDQLLWLHRDKFTQTVSYVAYRGVPPVYELSSTALNLKLLWLAPGLVTWPSDWHSIDLSGSKLLCMLRMHSTWVIFAPCCSFFADGIVLKYLLHVTMDNIVHVGITRMGEQVFCGPFCILPVFPIHLHVLYYPWRYTWAFTLCEIFECALLQFMVSGRTKHTYGWNAVPLVCGLRS